ncbi:MAG: acyl-ACP--UDP-N-acetylglucosamine O-acyltransferase [Alphaproteobacteria bacterium]
MSIHPTAIISSEARLAPDVEIGPYCVIEGPVELASSVCLKSHCFVSGHTKIGPQTTIFPFASIGSIPQDLKYQGEPSQLIIGAKNIIREHVTMNPGTQGGGMITRVGDGCLFMVGAHVGHDAQVGDHVIFANNATLAGHVIVGDFAVLGGLSAVHQFVRIGAHAMVGGMSGVENDVIPFTTVLGNRAHFAGVNLIGMRRRDFERQDIHEVRQFFRQLFEQTDVPMMQRVQDMRDHYTSPAVDHIVSFMTQQSDRAFCTPERREER